MEFPSIGSFPRVNHFILRLHARAEYIPRISKTVKKLTAAYPVFIRGGISPINLGGALIVAIVGVSKGSVSSQRAPVQMVVSFFNGDVFIVARISSDKGRIDTDGGDKRGRGKAVGITKKWLFVSACYQATSLFPPRARLFRSNDLSDRRKSYFFCPPTFFLGYRLAQNYGHWCNHLQLARNRLRMDFSISFF